MKSESRIQQEIFQWYWNTHCLPVHNPREMFIHIPNEGERNGRLTSIGLYSGASDIIFTYRGEHLYCEVKDATGTQKPNQKEFEEHVKQCGHTYFIVRSLDEFKSFIENLPNK